MVDITQVTAVANNAIQLGVVLGVDEKPCSSAQLYHVRLLSSHTVLHAHPTTKTSL